MYGRGGCVNNSSDSILKIDEQIQTLMDPENNLGNNNVEVASQTSDLKTDTKEITCIDNMDVIKENSNDSTKKVEVLKDENLVEIASNKYESEKVANVPVKKSGINIIDVLLVSLILIFIIAIFVLI